MLCCVSAAELVGGQEAYDGLLDVARPVHKWMLLLHGISRCPASVSCTCVSCTCVSYSRVQWVHLMRICLPVLLVLLLLLLCH